MTTDELIDALGGTKTVATQLGVNPSAVSNWRKLGALPPRLFMPFRDLCEGACVSLDELLFREIPREQREDARGDAA